MKTQFTKNMLPFLAFVLLTSNAFAGGGTIGSAGIADQEKAIAISTFLNLANNPRSEVGKRIAAINVETTDGRNHNGSIALPLTTGSLQVVLLENESKNAWKYADKKEGRCVGSDSNSRFLIMVEQSTNFNSGSAISTANFIVETQNEVSADIVSGAEVECYDVVSEDGADKFANYKSKATVRAIQEASIK